MDLEGHSLLEDPHHQVLQVLGLPQLEVLVKEGQERDRAMVAPAVEAVFMVVAVALFVLAGEVLDI